MKKKQKRQKRMIIALASAMLLVIMVPIMAAFAGEGDDIVTPSDTVLTNPTENDPEQVDPEQVDPDQVDPDQTDPDQTDPVVPSIPAVSESDTNQSTTPDTDENAGTEANPEANVVEGSIIVEPIANNLSDTPDMTQDYELWICYDLGYSGSGPNIHFNGQDDHVTVTVDECPDTTGGFLYWRDAQTGKIYYPGNTFTIKVSDIKFEASTVYEYGTESFIQRWEPKGWTLRAVWENTVIDTTANAWLAFNIPETNPDNYDLCWSSDGLNRYHPWRYSDDQAVPITYNVKTEEVTVKAGAKLQIPADMIPTLAGDTFVEWNTAIDGSGAGYQPGDYVPLNSRTVVDLYAIFKNTVKKNVAVLSFGDGMIGISDYAELSVQFNDNGIIPSVTFPAAMVNPPNTFDCWYNYECGKTFAAGKTYTNVDLKELMDGDFSKREGTVYVWFNAQWKEDAVAFDQEATLYLNYEGGPHVLTTNVKGTHIQSTDEWKYEGNHSIVIPADMSPDNADGYTFKGWNTSEYGVGTTYQPGQTFVFTSYPYAELYAYYESNTDFIVENYNNTLTITEADPAVGLVLVGKENINDVKLVVAKVEDNVKATVLGAVSEQIEITEINGEPNFQMIDLSLVDGDNNNVQIESGKIRIFLSYPNIPNAKDYNYTIYHYHDGIAEEVPVEKLENGLVFYARSFSPYALVWTEEPEEEQVSDNKPQEVVAPDTNEYIAVDADGNKYTADQIVIHGNTSPLSAESAAQFIKLVNGDPDRAAVYDITITNKDNKPLKLIDGKTIKVRLSVPRIGRTVSFRLYHISGDSAQSVSFSMNGGSPEFNASGFSPYVLTWHDINSTGSPGTGDDFSPVIFIVLILISASAAAGTIAYNKLKTKKSAVEA